MIKPVVLRLLVGVKVILVHGGGPEISAMLKRLSIESHFENGLRVTDDATAVIDEVVADKGYHSNQTLVDLEEVSAQIGLPLPTVAPPAPSEKPQEATAAPTDKPTPTAKPTASPAPEATKAPATEVPDKGATAAPKVSPTPGVPTVTPK